MRFTQKIYNYLKRYPGIVVITLFSIIVSSLCEGGSFGMIIPLVQSMVSGSADAFTNMPILGRVFSSFRIRTQADAIAAIFSIMFLILLIKNSFLYITNLFIAKFKFTLIRDLRIDLMSNLLEYDIKFFDSVKAGHIISNMNTETERIGYCVSSLFQFIALLVRGIAYIALLFLISWKASILIFLLITTVLIPIEAIVIRVKRIGAQLSQAIAGYNYKLTEILSGIRLIKISGTEEREGNDFKSAAENVYRVQYAGNKYIHLIAPLSEIFIFGLIVGCFLGLIKVVKIDMARSFPFIATYLLVLTKSLTQINTINSARSDMMNNIAAFENYEKMYLKEGKRAIESGTRKIEKFTSAIEFKNVTFSYIDAKEVLRNVSLRVPRGKLTALVGASGAGKSTIVNLIPRFYEINSGEVLVDGVNLKEIALKEWRRKIGFVSQDVFIFNSSVIDNLSYGHDYISTEEVIKAAKTANIHDFIMNLPDRYNTVLGERGANLSGGEKQRISIARAIIHNPEILILDEATSSLDTETERLITDAIEKLTKGRTVIAIAHRLSTILHADNIIVLKDGIVIEEGIHADLIKRQDGLYKKLYSAQFNIEPEARCAL